MQMQNLKTSQKHFVENNITVFPEQAYPEIFVAISILFLTLLGVFSDSKQAFKRVYSLSILVLIAALLLVLRLNSTTCVIFSGFYIHDIFSIFSKIFIIGFSFYLLLSIKSSLKEYDLEIFELPILLLTSILGLMILSSAHDFLTVFAGIELLSLSLYILIALRRKNLKSSEASLKYYILGALATGIMLYGMSYIYGFAGSTNFGVLERFFNNKTPETTIYLLFGFSFILIGLFFKISAAPFHSWAPDVYEGTPLPILTFLATLPKFAIISVLLRFASGPFSVFDKDWSILIMIVSIISMAIGGFAALTQTSLRRFIAYSSIGQIGFALIGITLATEQGYQRTILFLVFYSITLLGFMTGLLQISRRGHTLRNISDLNGIGRHHPVIATCIGLFIISMAGLPPLPGVFPKFMMLQSAIQNEYYGLSIVAVLYSVLAAAYYLMFMKSIFIDEPRHKELSFSKNNVKMTDKFYVIFPLFLLFYLFLFPNKFLDWLSHVTAMMVFS